MDRAKLVELETEKKIKKKLLGFFCLKKKTGFAFVFWGKEEGNMFFKVAVSFGFGTASKDGPKDGEAAAALHGKGGEKTCFFLPLFVVYIFFVVLFAFCIVFCIVCIVFLSW